MATHERRLCGDFVVPMAVLPNVSSPNEYEFPLVDVNPEVQVRCLSQTVRAIGDEEVGERDAVLVKSPFSWEERFLQDNFGLFRNQTMVSVDAFKCLEQEFTQVMESQCGMAEHRDTCLRLKEVIRNAARLLQQPIRDPDWHRCLPFGVFAYGLSRLIRLIESHEGDVEHIKDLLDKSKGLFYDIVEGALEDLQSKCLAEGVHADAVTLQHMKELQDLDCFESNVSQWAAISLKRRERNGIAHPWTINDNFTASARSNKFQFYQRTLNHDFAADFRGVGFLALLHLRAKDASTVRAEAVMDRNEDLVFYIAVGKVPVHQQEQ